jgi:predicted DNA-binding transcriptional regulator AlpA
MSRCIPVEDILGTSEVAEVLGVSKQRIHSLRQMKEFPEPVVQLASTPLWDRKDVVSFLAIWKPWKVINNELQI